MQALMNKARLPIVFAGLLLATPMAGAASQCTNLSADACATDSACAWVDGYTRKDGREVQAYCRKAPVRKDKQQSSTTPSLSGGKGMKG